MITTPPLPVWVKAVRLLGAGIGLLMICCSLAGGFPSIGAHIRWSYRHYVVCLHIFLGLLLMLRWSRIPLAPTLTFILVVFVICLVLLLPHYALAFTWQRKLLMCPENRILVVGSRFGADSVRADPQFMGHPQPLILTG